MIERIRTTKCGPITSEMNWRMVLREYRKLNDDNDEVMSLSASERASIMFAMFAENRYTIIKTLPKDLSEREFKEQVYFRTYGEHLPDDFFKDEVK